MVTELRVHGVSGATAESMLDRPLLHRVAGDGEAGFHRPRPEYGNTTGPGDAELEAYRWGNLTAGAAARALWLMLLPFMLANVSMWLRPPAGRRGAMLTRALCRVFALSITATFVLSFVGVALDLIAWQCPAAADRCVKGRLYLGFLTEGFFAPTGRRLAVVSLIPILCIALLWWLARRSWCRYELFPISETADGDGLAAPGFWAGRNLVGRLRSIHIAVALGTLTVVLAWVLAMHDRGAFGLVLAFATAALLVACLVAVCLPGLVSRDNPAPWADGLARTLRIVALVLLATTLGYALTPRDRWPTAGGLPGFALAVTSLFAAQTALLVVLGVVVWVQRERPRAFLAGLGTPILASIGLGVAVAFTAGLSYRVADYLDRSGVPSASEPRPLRPPATYEWTGFGFVVLVVVVLLVVGIGRGRILARLRRGAVAVTDADFPHGRSRDPARAKVIDHAIADARLTDHFGPLLAWAYAPLAVAAAIVTGLALAGIRPVDLADRGTVAAHALELTTNVGTYLIGLAAVALLVVGLLAYRYPGIRRVVGVLWDLGTFWPRAAHPLAPPSYAERVVPELVTRSTWLAERDGVVLSGHSQGSVLAAAAVLQLPKRARPRVALLTYGSPLLRLYGKLFPAYVNPAVLTQVADSVGGRWWNLWRDTDPIGGTVNRAADWRLRDPAAFDIVPGDTVDPAIEGHSAYPEDPVFTGAVTDLVARLGGDAPATR